MKTIFSVILILSISIVHAQTYTLDYSRVDSIGDYGIGKAIVSNTLGEYYATGETMLTSLYNGQPLNIISGNKSDGIILSKFSDDGDIIWSVFEQDLSSSSINRVSSISLDNQENVIIGGFYEYNLSFEDQSINSAFGSSENPFVAKFAPNGSIIWLRRIHTPGITSMGRITSVSTDSYGNIYFGGSFGGTMTFGGDTIQNWGYGDNFWGKMDDAGNVLWVRAAGSEIIEHGVSIAADSVGNLYVSGGVAPHPIPNYVGDSLNVKGFGFITKYSTAGQMQWLKTAEKGWFYPSNPPHERMINEKNGKVVITGYMKPENDTLRIAGLELVSTLTSVSDMVGYAMMLDEDGNGIWLNELLKSYQRRSQGIGFKSNGDVVVLINTHAGLVKHIGSIIDAGFKTNHFFTLNGSNGQVIDYFYPSHPNPYVVPDYGTDLITNSLFIRNDTILTTGMYTNVLNGVPRLYIGKYFASALGIDEKDLSKNEWLIYPNPSDGIVFIQSATSQISKVKNIEVFDGSGKLVYSRAQNFVNTQNIRLDLTHLRTGIYYIRIRTEKGIFTNKLIIKID